MNAKEITKLAEDALLARHKMAIDRIAIESTVYAKSEQEGALAMAIAFAIMEMAAAGFLIGYGMIATMHADLRNLYTNRGEPNV